MKAIAVALAAIFAATTAHAEKADRYYAELIEWVFEPCFAVHMALQVDQIDQESQDMGIGRNLLARLKLAERDQSIRELAETLASGDKNPTWMERRTMYPGLLRMCLDQAD